MAKPEDVELVRKGPEAIRAALKRRGGHSLFDLRDADLFGVNLRGAILVGADLRGTQLEGADLSYATLVQADLDGANLASASLRHANLMSASLGSVQVPQTDFSSATMGGTIVTSVDLSRATGLASVTHGAPSTIDVNTLIRTVQGLGDSLPSDTREFFQGAGVPGQLLDVLPNIASSIVYYRCFISYGEPDATFAERLYHSLRERGVTCWLYRLDATPGERTWKEIAEELRRAEKVIVNCSKPSLERDGVLKELEKLIDESPDKIIPVSLDHLWKDPQFRVIRGVNDLKPFLAEKNYVDFQGLPYDDAINRLLKGIMHRSR